MAALTLSHMRYQVAKQLHDPVCKQLAISALLISYWSYLLLQFVFLNTV